MGKDITEGCKVNGIDFKGNKIEGVVSNIIGFCNVAIVKTGKNRLESTEAYLDKLERVE